MVIFQAPGGSPGYNQFETLDAAVGFVEQLRNERDVSNARIFALEEVKFEMRPYYKVELQALTTSTGSGSADAEQSQAPPRSEQPGPGAGVPQTPASPSAPPAPSAPTPQQAPTAPPPAAQPAAPEAPGAPGAPGGSQQGATPDSGDERGSGQPARRGLFGR